MSLISCLFFFGHLGRLRDGLQGHFVAELGDLADQPLDLRFGLALVEIVDAEVLVGNAVVEVW